MFPKNKIIVIIAIITMSLFFDCASVGESYRPLPGLLYSNARFDGDFNPLNNVKDAKYEIGCIQHVLYIYSWGDAAAGSIANRAKMSQISFIDHSYMNFLFFYGKYCTHVYGE